MEIRVDKSLYSKQVLLKTAYSFSDRAYLHLSHDNQSWIVNWTDMPDQQVKPEMFENELISQQLREELLEKTKDVRTLLLSRAFASSAMQIEPDTSEQLPKNEANMPFDEDAGDAASILKGWFDS